MLFEFFLNHSLNNRIVAEKHHIHNGRLFIGNKQHREHADYEINPKAHFLLTSITITTSKRPAIAGMAYVSVGIAEVKSIRTIDKAAIIPPIAVFVEFL